MERKEEKLYKWAIKITPSPKIAVTPILYSQFETLSMFVAYLSNKKHHQVSAYMENSCE